MRQTWHAPIHFCACNTQALAAINLLKPSTASVLCCIHTQAIGFPLAAAAVLQDTRPPDISGAMALLHPCSTAEALAIAKDSAFLECFWEVNTPPPPPLPPRHPTPQRAAPPSQLLHLSRPDAQRRANNRNPHAYTFGIIISCGPSEASAALHIFSLLLAAGESEDGKGVASQDKPERAEDIDRQVPTHVYTWDGRGINITEIQHRAEPRGRGTLAGIQGRASH